MVLFQLCFPDFQGPAGEWFGVGVLALIVKQARQPIEYSFTVEKKISEHTYSEISKGANEYWKIYRSDGESPKEFIQRLAQVLDLALPPDYDFSEIEK